MSTDPLPSLIKPAIGFFVVAAGLAGLLLGLGCGSVEVAQLAAGDAGADLGAESAPDLGPPASDANPSENPASDAGAVEVAPEAPPPPPPSCSTLRPGHENPCALDCGNGCAACTWCGTVEGPTGCVAASGALCVARCQDCP